ncbi:hypothetical protein GCM10009755_14790 [Brevibacterium samyangense]|uniref:Thiol reductant ABC exporter subunit CydC n=2 Tax=Brevibacterium samyangense TaxID=366888 RepID=A0ABN2TFD2_9MICO
MLDALVDLRERIWLAFARTGTANRSLARGEVALTRLVSDVDDIRDLAPRVVLPPIVATVIAAAAVVVLGIVHPLAGIVMACGALVCGLLVPPLTLRLDARAGIARVRARRTVLERLSALLWAREDILVNGRAPAALAAFREADRAVGDAELRAVRATGVGEALITGAGVLTGVCMLPVLAPAVLSGALSGELLAVAVLLPLALIDPFLDALTATQQWPALRSVLARVPELDGPRDRAASTETADGDDHAGAARRPHVSGPVRALALEDVAVRWPGMDHDVVTGVNAEVGTGRWAVVSGPSGTGKTTLVSVLLGFLEPSAGTYRLDGQDMHGVDPADLEGIVAWCPQEAHVFDSSLRANLLIARGRDDAPSDEEMRAALVRVGLGDLVDEVGLGATIGAGGSHLSGGQRQRLAVARSFLARSSVVVLDEPTAHLDPEAAQDLMTDLRGGLGSQIVVLVTHDTGAARSGDERIELGRDAREYAAS